MKALLALSIGLCLGALTGCQENSFEQTARLSNTVPMIVPADYKEQVIAAIRSGAREPSSVRDLEMTEPRPMFMGAGDRIASCVRFNAKNGFGGFTGKTTYIAVFLGGKLSSLDSDETLICRSTSGYSPAKI